MHQRIGVKPPLFLTIILDLMYGSLGTLPEIGTPLWVSRYKIMVFKSSSRVDERVFTQKISLLANFVDTSDNPKCLTRIMSMNSF